jgi:chromate reductase, NAD(P)H dehydrogenase (quinone)
MSTHLFTGVVDLPLFSSDEDYGPLPGPCLTFAARSRLPMDSSSRPPNVGTVPAGVKDLLEWTVGGPEMDAKPVALGAICGHVTDS